MLQLGIDTQQKQAQRKKGECCRLSAAARASERETEKLPRSPIAVVKSEAQNSNKLFTTLINQRPSWSWWSSQSRSNGFEDE